MTRSELSRAIASISRLRGTFTLRSGVTSTEYFDKYRFEARPDLLAAIAEQMVPLLPPDTSMLAGLELGGVPLATALSLRTGLPALYVRKHAKEYGTRRIAEGLEFSGKRLCVVEDVITTGGAVAEAIRALTAGGAIILGIVCVIHRGGEGVLPIGDAPVRPLFLSSELPGN